MSNTDAPAISPIAFWTKYDPVKGGAPGEMRARDWVKWVKKGDAMRSVVEESIDRLKRLEGRPGPDGTPGMPNEWTVIKPAYEAWKAGQELPVDGTALEAWSGVTAEQARALRAIHIYTVEDFANMNDSAMAKVPFPNVRGMIRNAKAYLETLNRDTSIEVALSSRDAEIDLLKAQLAEMRNDMIGAMAMAPEPRAPAMAVSDEEIDAIPDDAYDAPAKRPVGRPRKVA